MISVGIDVSKGKSAICVLKPYGEIVCSPFEIQHVEKDLEDFHNLLEKLNGEIRIVMEVTGIYHLPVSTFLHDKGYFVSVINPFAMKKYAKDNNIRGAKTDKLDSMMIANYGIEMSLEEFTEEYLVWAEKKKYHRSRSKAEAVYELASNGIPTRSSSTPSTKMLVQEAISVLRAVDSSLSLILTQMQVFAKSLPEYSTVREMGGVGDVLAVKLIAKIGDVRRLHSAKALIAWAGIDPPPYESGQFIGSRRKITKQGSSTLRKVGYEVMRVLKSHPAPKDDAVYNYKLKKESEGKSKKHAKIAGLNKFLRIYYARVIAVYQ